MSDFLNARELSQRELPALCEFGAGSKVPAGFGYLGSDGAILPEYGAQLWINCRMTHMFSLFALADIERDISRELATHGIRAITEHFYDHENGGWFSYLETELDLSGKARPTSSRIAALTTDWERSGCPAMRSVFMGVSFLFAWRH